jgi:hypothetical protein
MQYKWWLRGKQRLQVSLLFNQQLFLLGRDIQSSRGNLLLEFGCRKDTSPYLGVHSLYIHEPSRRKQLILRGFGLVYCDTTRGGIFLNRKGFEIGFMAEATLPRKPWVPALLSEFRPPKELSEKLNAGKLLYDIVVWLRDYEAWVEDEHGRSLRIGQFSHYQRKGRAIATWSPRIGWEELRVWLMQS